MLGINLANKILKGVIMEKIIRTNTKGRLLYSIHKNQFRIEFGLVHFALSMDEYLVFERELKSISNKWTKHKTNANIQIPLKNIDIHLNLSPEEFISFIDLFGFKIKPLNAIKLKIAYSMN